MVGLSRELLMFIFGYGAYRGYFETAGSRGGHHGLIVEDLGGSISLPSEGPGLGITVLVRPKMGSEQNFLMMGLSTAKFYSDPIFQRE